MPVPARSRLAVIVSLQQQIGHSEERLYNEFSDKGGRDLVVDRGWCLLAGDFPEKTAGAA
jgi:hypothetical protein